MGSHANVQRILSARELLDRSVESSRGAWGKLQVQSGVSHLVVEKLWKPEVDTAPCETKSRDFH